MPRGATPTGRFIILYILSRWRSASAFTPPVPVFAFDGGEVDGEMRLANLSRRHHGERIFFASPFFGPLLFDNTDSDCRDHCANERSALHQLSLFSLLASPPDYFTPYHVSRFSYFFFSSHFLVFWQKKLTSLQHFFPTSVSLYTCL